MFRLIPTLLFLFSVGSSTGAADSELTSRLRRALQQASSAKENHAQQAIHAIRNVLAAAPSREEILQALAPVHWPAVMAIVNSGPDGVLLVRDMVSKSRRVAGPGGSGERELDLLAKTAVLADDYVERFDAGVALARKHGELAVPELVAFLSVENTDVRINAHVTLMRRIGRWSVLPLIEALRSKKADVRRMVLTQLGVIGDERCLPALVELIQSEPDELVLLRTHKAYLHILKQLRMPPAESASRAYLRLAQLYYKGDDRVMHFSPGRLVIWSWQGGLESRPVSEHLYVIELAKKAVSNALRIDPKSEAALTLQSRILESEKLASGVLSRLAKD